MSTTTITKKKKSSVPRCDRKRCMNDAQLFPILIIPAPKWSINPKAKIEMELDMNVCNLHAVNEVGQFMDDIGWQQLVENFKARRMALPERERITVEFKALEDRKFS